MRTRTDREDSERGRDAKTRVPVRSGVIRSDRAINRQSWGEASDEISLDGRERPEVASRKSCRLGTLRIGGGRSRHVRKYPAICPVNFLSAHSVITEGYVT